MKRLKVAAYLSPFVCLAAASVFSMRLMPVASYLSNPAPLSRFSSFDAAGLMMGARKFASDIAWIRLLEYVGTDEEYESLSPQERFLLEYASSKVLFGLDFLDAKKAAELKESLRLRRLAPATSIAVSWSDKSRRHKDIYDMTLRVVRLDPHFKYAYLFSGGALAWNYGRTDEALAILREGIQNNPDYWQFHLYISAILYKQDLKNDEMLSLLEMAIKEKDAPNMV
ncbi:MAG: hypothetical protein QME32_04465, partial [Endomicrobiia bacterium]|nr:hypothetical protein [Endomicrobiia bacterium]